MKMRNRRQRWHWFMKSHDGGEGSLWMIHRIRRWANARKGFGN